MNNIKRLIGHASGLVTVSIVLVVAVVALFITNVGFGWMAKATHADAQGMLVDVDNPGSPVYSYEMYYVYDAKPETELIYDENDNTKVIGERIYNAYYFAELEPGETAPMVLQNYSKLEAPKYHLLLHISIDSDLNLEDTPNEDLYVDLHNSEPSVQDPATYGSYGDNKYIVPIADLKDHAKESGNPLGLSAALEFYLLGAAAGVEWIVDHPYESDGPDDPVPEDKPTANVFKVCSDMLPAASATFKQGKTDDQKSLTFEGVMAEEDADALTITVGELNDVTGFTAGEAAPAAEGDGDGYLDLFVFMTYSAELVGLLQNYAADGATEELGSFNFRSDVFLLIRKDYE